MRGYYKLKLNYKINSYVYNNMKRVNHTKKLLCQNPKLRVMMAFVLANVEKKVNHPS